MAKTLGAETLISEILICIYLKTLYSQYFLPENKSAKALK